MKAIFFQTCMVLFFIIPIAYADTTSAGLCRENRIQEVQYVSRFANLSRVLERSDRRFVIRHKHNLHGKIIKVGANSTLDFQNGSFAGGTLILDDNVVITGNPVFYYSCSSVRSDTEYVGYTNQGGTCYFRSPIIIRDHSNILIENAHFIMETERESKKWHGAIICYGDVGCRNIKISNCFFYGDKVAFYSNVSNSEISECKFTNIPFTAIAIETTYDHSPWRYPKNIIIRNNTIEQNLDAIGESSNAMWCSGVEDLTIENNVFKVLQGILLYCGDGNVVLKGVDVCNNTFSLLTRPDGVLKNMAAISLMGKSFQFLSDVMPEQSVVIKDNYLKSVDNASGIENVGISLLFASNAVIERNVVEGFTLGVNVCDHFRGSSFHVNRIILHNNTFEEIKRFGINVDCEPQLMEIVNNEFTSVVREDNGNELKTMFLNGNVERDNIILNNNKIFWLNY